jgi:hypothetical protein
MSFNGNWKIIIKSPMGDQESTLSLSDAENKLTGRQSSMFGSGEIQNGAVDGDKATWSIEMTSPIAIHLTFSAHVDGDTISGTVNAGAFGDSPFNGSRT